MAGGRDEVREVGRVLGTVAADGVAIVQGVHHGIARRAFAATGPVGRPAHLAHDAVAGAVYGAVRAAAGAVPAAGGAVAAAVLPAGAPSLATTPAGRAVLGAVNGIIGDTLAERHAPLAFPMTLRVDVPPDDATSKVVVFVHGLCETDEAWRPSSTAGFGARLRALGFTPVYVRYNSGLRVPENGRRLAELLDGLVASWPVAVTEVALVGHSMGGLVARSACHAGGRWTGLVGHVCCLGTPHLGAPLAQGVHGAAWALGRLPETKALATFLDRRSLGVRDLRHGTVSDDGSDVPFLPGATYCCIGVTVTRSPRHPLGRLVGDLLVRSPSARGRSRTRSIEFEVENTAVLGGLHHFDLLTHPTVADQLERWLSRPDCGVTNRP